MNYWRLIAGEIHKLVNAPVFMVAPIVLAVYLGLMLFGFEMSAAKKGVDFSVAVPEQFSGSIVVEMYSSVKKMAKNVLGIPRISPGLLEQIKARNEKPIEERELLEETPVFSYWRSFIRGLVHPKSLPVPGGDGPCKEAPTKTGPPAAPASNGGARKEGFLPLLVGVAYAESAHSPKIPVPPSFTDEELFSDRVKKRLQWLMGSADLEGVQIDRTVFNGLRFTYLSVYFAFIFVFPLITVAVAAQMFASEFAHGTIRTCLLRPVRRSQLLAAKFAVLLGYLLALVFCFMAVTLALGVLFTGYGNLVLDSDVIGNVGKVKMILGDGALLLFLLSSAVIAYSLLPLAAFAVLLSFIKPEPAYVVGISAIVYFILYSLGQLELFQDIRFLFFTTYMDGWMLLFETPVNMPLFVLKLGVVLLVTAGLAAAINYFFSRRDIYA